MPDKQTVPPLKIYADAAPYHPDANRFHLSNVLKIIWNDLTPSQRFEKYGHTAFLFEPAASIADADLCLLTMQWNYYKDHALEQQAVKEADFALRHHKPLVVFGLGDYPARLPFDGAILFETAGYRSDGGFAYHSGHPAFIKDYLEQFCGGALRLRPWREEPMIGFCGQADDAPLRSSFRKIRMHLRQVLYRRGFLRWEPPPFETVSFRSRVLRQFVDQPGVKTNYLLRKRYHAGESGRQSDSSPAKTAFAQNMLESDYVVCMRGGGNYSVRFYETLALGRIPVFINTDCLLPFDDVIPYREIFPWIEPKDFSRAAEIVAKFHQALSPGSFADLQRVCRNLWVEHFQRAGFYHDFAAKMKEFI